MKMQTLQTSDIGSHAVYAITYARNMRYTGRKILSGANLRNVL